MKKIKIKKLELAKETVWSPEETLKKVAGGMSYYTGCPAAGISRGE